MSLPWSMSIMLPSWGFFFSSRRRHTRYWRDWSSDVCSSDLDTQHGIIEIAGDLDGESAVIEGLGELAVGDSAAADENDGPHEPGGGAKDGERGAGIDRKSVV